MNTFFLHVLAADKTFYEGECESLIIPTVDGLYGIQARHQNMIAAIVPGLLRYRLPDGKTEVAAVSEGLIKVEDNEVMLLIDTIERPEEIDANRAQRAADEAKEILLQQRSRQEFFTATASLARAMSRLQVKKYEK